MQYGLTKEQEAELNAMLELYQSKRPVKASELLRSSGSNTTPTFEAKSSLYRRPSDRTAQHKAELDAMPELYNDEKPVKASELHLSSGSNTTATFEATSSLHRRPKGPSDATGSLNASSTESGTSVATVAAPSTTKTAGSFFTAFMSAIGLGTATNAQKPTGPSGR